MYCLVPRSSLWGLAKRRDRTLFLKTSIKLLQRLRVRGGMEEGEGRVGGSQRRRKGEEGERDTEKEKGRERGRERWRGRESEEEGKGEGRGRKREYL